ncbi:gliding motility-associated C-terminal domain-containing protein [Echinicola strongylocentroti]|uniref:Gliding motility-associated C-terminal domain-containing protein n=1 Tax=Echinicola strongylocentroti TaxID=1795355 RepID=A0A2Z4IMB2_9BACT|nr:Ig-like domain-containing protein [Echinicola strongylocentroti]AWW31736.1 gliding motility-associated C-terminal domain-containing protein [Echinicola strongylocentroti]
MKRTLLLCIMGIMLCGAVRPFSGGMTPGASPVINTTPGYTEFEPGKGAVTIDKEVTVTDEDSPKAAKAVVKLTNLPDGGNEFINIAPDVVDLANDNGLTVNYNFTNGELTITGEADFSLYQRIFRELTYNNFSPIPDIADRIVKYSIYDTEGNTSAEQTRIIRVKNVPAVITEIQPVADGLYGIDDAVAVTVVFNRPVWVNGGTPQIPLQIGEQAVMASYSSGAGSKELVFVYTVVEGDLDEDGVEFTQEVRLNDAAIVDSVDEPADLQVDGFPSTSGIGVDGIRPFVAAVTLPEDGAYSVCGNSMLKFVLSMSETVTANEDIKLDITLDAGARTARFVPSESTADELVFVYDVASGDKDENGISVSGLALGEGVIADQAGNELTDIALDSAAVAEANNIIIDGTAPAPPQVTAITPDSGVSSSDGITNTSALMIAGTAEADLSVEIFANDDKVGEAMADSEGKWTFDATGLEWEEGQYELSAVAVDGSCNSSESSNTLLLTLDLNGPLVSVTNTEVSLGENGEVLVTIEELVDSYSDNYSSMETIELAMEKDVFTCEDLGENTVTITATDLAGNVTETNALVTVVHNEALSFVVEDLEVSLDENGLAELVYSDVVKGLNGTCLDLDRFTFELSKSSFSCGDVGSHNVSIAITGENGFTASEEALVKVTDDAAPQISGGDENVDVFVGLSGEYVMENYLEIFEVSDNCTVAMTNQSPAEGAVLTGYGTPHVVKITATDDAGNVTEHEFTITLKSNIIASLVDPDLLTVSWGTEEEELPLPEQVEAVLVSGETVMVEVAWDIQHYDNMSPGLYQNAGTVSLTESGYSYDGDRQPMLTIVVNEKSLPEDILLSEDEFSVEDDPNAPLGILTTVDVDDDQHSYALIGEYDDEQFFYILGDRLFWTPEAMPEDQHEFTITISSTDRIGNSITKTFLITRSKPALDDLTISNVFSPNGDDINDDWGVPSLKFYGEVKLMIFERSGKMVFVTYDPEERWDGRYEGGDLPVGSYYYVIELGEEQAKRRGVLTLIRN